MQIFKDRYEYLKERPQERERSRRGQVASPPPAFLFCGGWEGQEKSLARRDGCSTSYLGPQSKWEISRKLLQVGEESKDELRVCMCVCVSERGGVGKTQTDRQKKKKIQDQDFSLWRCKKAICTKERMVEVRPSPGRGHLITDTV